MLRPDPVMMATLSSRRPTSTPWRGPGARRARWERYRRGTKRVKTRPVSCSARLFVCGVLAAPLAELPDLDALPVVHLVLRRLVIAVLADITRERDAGPLVTLRHVVSSVARTVSQKRSWSIRTGGMLRRNPWS